MKCSYCGDVIDDGMTFCGNCGAPATGGSTTSVVVPSRVGPASTPAFSTTDISLMAWVIIRWFIQTNYVTLSLSDDHLRPRIRPTWRFVVLDVLSRFFFFGFDPLSFIHMKSTHQLKNVTSAGIWTWRWIVWRWNFLWVTGAGIFILLPFSDQQRDEVHAFVEQIQQASTRAKYALSQGDS